MGEEELNMEEWRPCTILRHCVTSKALVEENQTKKIFFINGQQLPNQEFPAVGSAVEAVVHFPARRMRRPPTAINWRLPLPTGPATPIPAPLSPGLLRAEPGMILVVRYTKGHGSGELGPLEVGQYWSLLDAKDMHRRFSKKDRFEAYDEHGKRVDAPRKDVKKS